MAFTVLVVPGSRGGSRWRRCRRGAIGQDRLRPGFDWLLVKYDVAASASLDIAEVTYYPNPERAARSFYTKRLVNVKIHANSDLDEATGKIVKVLGADCAAQLADKIRGTTSVFAA